MAERSLLQESNNARLLKDNNITNSKNEIQNSEDWSMLILAVEKVALVNTTKLEDSLAIRGDSTNSKLEITCEGEGILAFRIS